MIIDDASNDTTLEIAERHAAEDSRIRIIRQKTNKGLSVGRNIGIRDAKGKYLIMLDGDDLFDPDMVVSAVELAEKDKAQMVMWDYFPFRNEVEINNSINVPSALEQLVDLDLREKRHALVKRPGFMWTHMIRVDALRKLKITFPIGLTKQDIPIHWQLVTQLDKISIVPKKMAFYRIQPTATSCRKDKSVFALATVMDITGDYLTKAGLMNEYSIEFWTQRLSLLHGMYDFIKPEHKEEAMSIVKERLMNSEATVFIQNNASLLSFRTKLFYGMLGGNTIDAILYRLLIVFRAIYRKVKSIV